MPKVQSITVGFRYKRAFKIRDHFGRIADEILFTKDSPLDPTYFPNQNYRAGDELVLFNSQTESYLRINTDDVIFKHGCVNDRLLTKDLEFVKKCIGFISKILFEDLLQYISRAGIVFTHQVDKTSPFYEKITSKIKPSLIESTSYNVSFSNKFSTNEAQLKKGVNDFCNAIYAFDGANDIVQFGLDFQKYFDPPLEKLRDMSEGVDGFIDEGLKYLNESYYSNLGITEDEKKE